MERNTKTSQYTFTPNEKEVLNILATFENELGGKLQQTNGEIEQIKYYENFLVKGIKEVEFEHIFKTIEKDENGRKSLHIYCKDISDEILSIDADGNIKVKPELEAILGDIDIEKMLEENEKEPERLKGMSEKAKPKEIENQLKKQKDDSEEKENNEEEKKEERIEQDLSEDLEEDLEIVDYKKISDSKLDKQVEETIGTVEEKGIAYSRKQNAFVLVIKKDGKFEKAEGFEKAKPTMKTVYNMDGKAEKKVPHALMQTNQDNKELSITIDQYGYVETGIVNKLNSGERIENQVENQQGKESNIKENEDRMSGYSSEQALIEKAAKEARLSVSVFKEEYLDKTSGSNLAERIEEAQKRVVADYRGTNDRNRR